MIEKSPVNILLDEMLETNGMLQKTFQARATALGLSVRLLIEKFVVREIDDKFYPHGALINVQVSTNGLLLSDEFEEAQTTPHL